MSDYAPGPNPGTVGTTVVGPAGSNYPYNGADIAVALNAAGASQKTNGGNVYVTGGIGTVYKLATQFIRYNRVNYFGDGATLRANAGLVAPIASDVSSGANAVLSTQFNNFTLDGNGVAGVTLANWTSIQKCLDQDITYIGCNTGAAIANTGSPQTYTNPYTYPVVVQLLGGTVSSISVNGVTGQATSGVFVIGPGNTMVVASSVFPTTWQQCSVAKLLSSLNSQPAASNTFVADQFANCQVEELLSGDAVGVFPVTNNTSLGRVNTSGPAQYAGVAGTIVANNADSNNWTGRYKGALLASSSAYGIIFNAFDPTTDQKVYANVFEHASFDVGAATSQTGVLFNAGTHTFGNRIERFQPTSIPNPVVFGATVPSWYFVHDVTNNLYYRSIGNKGTTGVVSSLGLSPSLLLSPGNPAAITSVGTFVMLGLANGTNPLLFTPNLSGIVEVTICGTLDNTTATDTVEAQVAWGLVSGGIPANGAAATGTVVGKNFQFKSTAANQPGVFSKTVRIATAGVVQVWVDLQAEAVTGGTAVFINIDATLKEVET